MKTCSANVLTRDVLKAKRLRIGYQTFVILDFRFWILDYSSEQI